MFFKNKKSRRFDFETAKREYKDARAALIGERIRGELISWNNRLKYLSRLLKKDSEDWLILSAAKECYFALSFPYPANEYPADFRAGVFVMQNKITDFIMNLSPDYQYNPVNSLINIAGSGSIESLIDYIEELEKVATSI